jgi:predicted nucleotide-binding protein (sugar kinase/HSP70/actin superfamily)
VTAAVVVKAEGGIAVTVEAFSCGVCVVVYSTLKDRVEERNMVWVSVSELKE